MLGERGVMKAGVLVRRRTVAASLNQVDDLRFLTIEWQCGFMCQDSKAYVMGLMT